MKKENMIKTSISKNMKKKERINIIKKFIAPQKTKKFIAENLEKFSSIISREEERRNSIHQRRIAAREINCWYKKGRILSLQKEKKSLAQLKINGRRYFVRFACDFYWYKDYRNKRNQRAVIRRLSYKGFEDEIIIPLRAIYSDDKKNINLLQKRYNEKMEFKRSIRKMLPGGCELIDGNGLSPDIKDLIIKKGAHLYHICEGCSAEVNALSASRAFQKKEMEKFHKEREAGILAQAERIFVSPEDSVRAGNCPQGTRDFILKFFPSVLERGGIRIRGSFLLSLQDDEFTRRAIVFAGIKQGL